MEMYLVRLMLVLLLFGLLINVRVAAGGEHPTAGERPPHPRLIFGPEDLPRLRARLGGGRVGCLAGAALTGLLQGRRDDASIKQLLTATDRQFYEAALIYDFQYAFMTDEERRKGRELLLADAEALRQKAAATRKAWYFTKHTNNWVISYAGYPAQRILWPGILFPDDPRSEGLRKQGLTLLRNFFQDPDTAIEFIEESLTAVNGYGLYDVSNLSYTMMILDRNRELVDLDPYRHHDRLFYSEGRYRTYLYQSTSSAKSSMYGCAGAPQYTGIYCVPLGGHGKYIGHPFVPGALVFLTGAYREPVFAWLHLKASKREAWPSGGDFRDLRDLFFRGCVAPKSPQEAGWPLSAYFPKAGVHIMRQSWDPDGSVVACHSGWGGSHYQPCQGQVVFTGRGYTVLGKVGGGRPPGYSDAQMGYGAKKGEPGYLFSRSPYANNILMVDGKSQESHGSLRGAQRKLADMRRLGPDAVEMDPSAAYAEAGIEVGWKRIVRYDRRRDLVIIEDSIDGGKKELTFNWVTEGTVVDDCLYDMPGPYFMAAKMIGSPGALKAKNVKHFDYWPSIQVSARAGKLRVVWAVGPGKELVTKALNEDHSELGVGSGG